MFLFIINYLFLTDSPSYIDLSAAHLSPFIRTSMCRNSIFFTLLTTLPEGVPVITPSTIQVSIKWPGDITLPEGVPVITPSTTGINQVAWEYYFTWGCTGHHTQYYRYQSSGLRILLYLRVYRSSHPLLQVSIKWPGNITLPEGVPVTTPSTTGINQVAWEYYFTWGCTGHHAQYYTGINQVAWEYYFTWGCTGHHAQYYRYQSSGLGILLYLRVYRSSHPVLQVSIKWPGNITLPEGVPVITPSTTGIHQVAWEYYFTWGCTGHHAQYYRYQSSGLGILLYLRVYRSSPGGGCGGGGGGTCHPGTTWPPGVRRG